MQQPPGGESQTQPPLGQANGTTNALSQPGGLSSQQLQQVAIEQIRKLPTLAYCQYYGKKCEAIDKTHWPSIKGAPTTLHDEERGRKYKSTSFRQSVSHYFGRNKKQTRTVKPHILPMCRPCYQKQHYHHVKDKNALAWQEGLIGDTISRFLQSVSQPQDVRWEIYCNATWRNKLINPRAIGEPVDKEDEPRYYQAQCNVIMAILRQFEGKGKTNQDVYDCLTQLTLACERHDIIKIPQIEYLPERKTSA